MRSLLTSKAAAFAASAALMTPILVGCGGPSANTTGANLPPIDASQGGYRAQSMPAQNQGMSTKTKLAILAGAAALYYMYNKNKQQRAQGNTAQPQYYLSKNGRVYYRDNTGRAVWVTPPANGIQVPYEEAQQYSQYQGYNNQPSGRTLLDLYNSGGY